MATHTSAETPPSQGRLFRSFDPVAQKIGTDIATGVLGRIESFPRKEAILGAIVGRMDSLPEDILWEGLGEESPAVFVVYKLLHEAFSSAPKFFRTALVEFLRAQPDRFSAVFNRETIWSVLAASRTIGFGEECPPAAEIAKALAQTQKGGIWWRPEAEIRREAGAVYRYLTADDGASWRGLKALRALQSEKARGITCGNLLLHVPGRLAAYANEMVSLGRMKSLPPLKEMHDRIDEYTRDRETDTRPESIPLDLLYTSLEDDLLHVRILARAKGGISERAEIRRRSLCLRYFLRKAFAGYRPDQLDLKLAFYLDSESAHASWKDADSLFHREEWITRDVFWNELCPGANPEELFAVIRRAATRELTLRSVVEKLKKHFARAAGR